MKLLEFLTSRCLLDVFGMHSGCVRDEGAKRNRGGTSQVPPMYVPSKSHFLQREWEDEGRVEGEECNCCLCEDVTQ